MRLIPSPLKSQKTNFRYSIEELLVVLTTPIREGVVSSVERREECRLTINFTIDNPVVTFKRVGFHRRSIDISVSSVLREYTIPESSVKQRIKEASTKIAKFLDSRIQLAVPHEFLQLTIVFSTGKITELNLSVAVKFGEGNG